MPRELPGFFFDAERNRYFPLASRASNQTAQSAKGVVQQAARHDARAGPSHRIASTNERVRSLHDFPAALKAFSMSRNSQQRLKAADDMFFARLACTSREPYSEPIHWPFHSTSSIGRRVCAFRTGPTRQWLGDSQGWLYSRRIGDVNFEEDDLSDAVLHAWVPELCLAPGSEISALCSNPARCVAICFGPQTKICVQESELPDRTAIFNVSTVRDVRAASLDASGASLLMGAAGRTVFIPSLDHCGSRSGSVNTLRSPGGSDVFAVTFGHELDTHLVYSGTRSGCVLRFDTRAAPTSGKRGDTRILIESTTKWDGNRVQVARSSVVSLTSLRDGQAVVAGFLDGRMGLYDLRFLKPEAVPVVQYAENANSVSARLGVCVDASERTLFSAGEDCRLRGWELWSGAALHTLANSQPSTHSPFRVPFNSPLITLQSMENGALWGATQGSLWRWQMGV
ncbi:unnamed protein product [Mycena citricolor]|uniref:WD40 repeat-like protein n=1 Tax=Mycena citricolor TaxID=2018698 RepID=A0AAD2K7X8_9AGAR|nr:unnamed protein product [Mycena citricolor]